MNCINLMRETQNYLSNSFNNSNNIISSTEQKNKEKEELINTFCSKTVQENANNVLYLPLNEMNKQSIEHSLQSLSINNLKKLSDATQLFFNYLQPTNERRHDVIQLFLVLPSSEWVQIQQLAAHYLCFNCCIDSLIKGLSVLVELNSRTAREQLIQLASQSVKFDTPPLERARILSDSLKNYIDSLTKIFPEKSIDQIHNDNNSITDPVKIQEYITSRRPFLVLEDFHVKKESIEKKSSIIDLL